MTCSPKALAFTTSDAINVLLAAIFLDRRDRAGLAHGVRAMTASLSPAQEALRQTYNLDAWRDRAMLEPRCDPAKVHLNYIRKMAQAYSAFRAAQAKLEELRP
jgi:hypothetical protein